MGTKSTEVDAYIERSAEFARPILHHLRRLVHAACPDVEETLKWGFPHFMHKGILCSMASFKAHCAFGFWKGALILRGTRAAGQPDEDAMGQFGRISARSDLPADAVLLRYIREAVRLNDAGVKKEPRPKPRQKKPVTVPGPLRAALKENQKALKTFEAFSPSHQREYVEWITEAKREETKRRRLATAIEWMAEGKPRNWKYMRR